MLCLLIFNCLSAFFGVFVILNIVDHLELPLSCLYSLLLPVTLTSSAPRRTCHSCWSPSPTSSWHKVLTKIKIFVHTLLVGLSSVHTQLSNVQVSWCAVTQWWFSSFDCLKWNQTHFFFHRRSESDWHTCHKHFTSTHLHLSGLHDLSYLISNLSQ